jgi:FKBP-type peptidyl-prolyl cis-trans isomerase
MICVSVHKQRREKSKENEQEQQGVCGSAACKKNVLNLITNDLNTLHGKFGDGKKKKKTDRLDSHYKR